MDLHAQMHDGLKALVQDTAGWGVLIVMQAPGDVPFATPIVPSLRGCEIVANPNGGYDVWENGKPTKRWNQTKPQIQAWLARNTPQDEQELKKRVVAWTEQTFDYFGIPRPGPPHSGVGSP